MTKGIEWTFFFSLSGKKREIHLLDKIKVGAANELTLQMDLPPRRPSNAFGVSRVNLAPSKERRMDDAT